MAWKVGPRWDKQARRWYARIGPLKTPKGGGRPYRAKEWAPEEIAERDERGAWEWFGRASGAGVAPAEERGEITVAQMIEFYLEWADGSGAMSGESLAIRRGHLARVTNWPDRDDPRRIGARAATAFTRAAASEFAVAMLEGGASPHYVSDGLLNSIKAAYSWAAQVEPGLYAGLPLASNPLAGLKAPAKPRRKLRALEPEAVGAFLEWARARAERMGGLTRRFGLMSVTLVEFIHATGCRPKEACVAEWSEWRLLDDGSGWGLLTLPPWKWKNGRKTARDRDIAVPPAIAAKVEAIRGMEGRHPTRIFTRRRNRVGPVDDPAAALAGEPFVWLDHERRRKGDTRAFRCWFKRLANLARSQGVPVPDGFSLYWLRSGYATSAARKGVNVQLLAQQMGTSPEMLASHYIDLDRNDSIRAARLAVDGRTDASPGQAG